MRFTRSTLLLLPLLTFFAASTSFANSNSCPSLQRSQQGAGLLIIDKNFRVRIQDQNEQVDLGIKVTALGDDYHRSQVDKTSSAALVLQGAVSITTRERKSLDVVYAGGTTHIFTEERIIAVNSEGQVTCSAGDKDAAALYVALLELEGYKVSFRKVETASREALASALGLS